MPKARLITCRGMTKNLNEWAKTDGCTVSSNTIKDRLNQGLDPEEAIFSPSYASYDSRVANATKYLYGDDMLTVVEISEETGMSHSQVRRMCKQGKNLINGPEVDEEGHIIARRKRVYKLKNGKKVTKVHTYRVNGENRGSRMDGVTIPEKDKDLPLKNLIKSLMAMGFKGSDLLAEAKKRVAA